MVRPPVTYDLTDAEQDDNGGLARWGIGALIALLVGVGVYYVYQNTQDHATEEPTATEINTIGDSVQTTDTVARSLAVPVDPNPQPRTTPATAATTATGMAVGAPPTTAPAETAGALTQQVRPYLHQSYAAQRPCISAGGRGVSARFAVADGGFAGGRLAN